MEILNDLHLWMGTNACFLLSGTYFELAAQQACMNPINFGRELLIFIGAISLVETCLKTVANLKKE